MAKAERGTKRQCLKCGDKFYDLNNDPIVCPNCEAPFEVAAAVPVVEVEEKPAKAAETEADSTEADVDKAAVEAGAEVVSFDDVEEKDDDDDDDDDVLAEVAGVDDVEDIGGEVSNSFIESDDDDDDDAIGIPVTERRTDDE